MAEEEEINNEEVEPTVEEPGSSEEVIEQKARSQGWKPFEEWDGDPNEWVGPEAFVVRGELFDKIKNQSKTIKELHTVVDELKRHHQKVSEKEYQKALNYLQNQKKQAMENEDYDKVVQIDDKMAEVRDYQKQEAQQAEQNQNQSNPQFEEWLEKPENQWYKNNSVLRAAADRLAEEYVANQNQNATFDEVVSHVEKQLKQEFPDKFGTKKKQQPSTVNEPNFNNTGTSSKKAKVSKLSEDQKAIGNKFVKQGIFKNLTEYAQELSDIGEI